MVLTNAIKGNTHRITRINAESTLLGKLAALGLVPGSEIEILQNSIHGAAIVSCKGSQFVLGRGLAELIQLQN